jgi:hypothetical protein
MAEKRLQILFQTSSLFLDGEEDELKPIVRAFTIGLQGGMNMPTIIWSDTYCICLQYVVAMIITDQPRKQEEEDEPWKRSLRPDDNEE